MWYSENIMVTARHLSDSNYALLQERVVTRFGGGSEPHDVMGYKAFQFAITPCCLIFQCKLLRVGIFAMKFTPFR